MKPAEAAVRAHLAFSALRLDEFHRRVKDWTRGGFSASSIPEGSRSAEAALPLPDGFDRELDRLWRDTGKDLEQAARCLEAVVRRQNWLLFTAPPPPVLVEVACENVACDKWLEPGRKSGECSRCRQHRHRCGLVWPKGLKEDVA